MKKILLATTILAASAGFASADVAVGMSAGMWLANDGNTTTVKHSIDVTFAGTGTTDGGLSFGANLDLQEDGTTDGPGTVFISGAFGKIAFGDVDGADAAVGAGMNDVGFDGLGVDNVAEQRRNDSGSEVLYTYSSGALTFAASADSPDNSNDYAVGVAYAAGSFTVALGYADAGGDKITNGAVKMTSGAFSGGLYVESADYGTSYGLNAAYTTGAVTVSAAWATSDIAADAYGVDVTYDLGGGAKVKGGIANVNNTTVADLGVSMSF